MGDFAKLRERDAKGRFVIPLKPSGFDRATYRKKYYQEHKEHKMRVANEWNKKNKERRKVITDRWRAKNKDRTNFLTRRYIYRKKNASGTHTLVDEKFLYSSLPMCIYCNVKKSDTIDHIIPLSRGGGNGVSNLLACCRSCNSKKGSKTLWEFSPILGVMLDRINL